MALSVARGLGYGLLGLGGAGGAAALSGAASSSSSDPDDAGFLGWRETDTGRAVRMWWAFGPVVIRYPRGEARQATDAEVGSEQELVKLLESVFVNVTFALQKFFKAAAKLIACFAQPLM